MICVILVPLTSIASEGDLDLATVLHLTALHGAFHSHYVERREAPLLSRPVEVRGDIEFRPPDDLRMSVTGSHAARFILHGERLVIEKDSAHHELDVAQVPGLSALMSGLRALSQGDAAALTRRFDVRVAGTREQWTLTLQPKDSGAARHADDPTAMLSAPRVVELSLTGDEGGLGGIAWHNDAGERVSIRFTGKAE